MQFHLGLALPLWGRICKWHTNELKIFSLWELINQGAPLLHISIFLKSSQGSPVTNYSAFPGQLHWTSAPLSNSEHHTCIFAPFIFSRALQGRGLLRREEDGRMQGKSESEGGGNAAGRKTHRSEIQQWNVFRKRLENKIWYEYELFSFFFFFFKFSVRTSFGKETVDIKVSKKAEKDTGNMWNFDILKQIWIFWALNFSFFSVIFSQNSDFQHKILTVSSEFWRLSQNPDFKLKIQSFFPDFRLKGIKKHLTLNLKFRFFFFFFFLWVLIILRSMLKLQWIFSNMALILFHIGHLTDKLEAHRSTRMEF